MLRQLLFRDCNTNVHGIMSSKYGTIDLLIARATDFDSINPRDMYVLQQFMIVESVPCDCHISNTMIARYILAFGISDINHDTRHALCRIVKNKCDQITSIVLSLLQKTRVTFQDDPSGLPSPSVPSSNAYLKKIGF